MRCKWSAINMLTDLAAQGLLWGVPLHSPHAGGKHPGGTRPFFHHPTCSGSEHPSYQHSLHCHLKGSLVSCRPFLMSLLGKKTVQGLLWTIQIWPLLLVFTSRSDGELCAQHSPETPAALRSKGKWNKLPKDHAAKWATVQESACSPHGETE